MNQHTQQISPTTLQRAQRYTKQISAITELDLPQSGSEDDDETWFNELIGSEATGAHEAAKEAYIQFEEYLKIISPSRQNLKTQSVGEPDLPRTTQPLVTPISAAPCTISGYLWMWFAWTPVPGRWWRLFTMRSGFAPGRTPSVFELWHDHFRSWRWNIYEAIWVWNGNPCCRNRLERLVTTGSNRKVTPASPLAPQKKCQLKL